MALISCKECGKEISSIAECCPHCGHKTRFGKEKEEEHIRAKNASTLLCILCISIVLLILGIYLLTNAKFALGGGLTTGSIFCIISVIINIKNCK